MPRGHFLPGAWKVTTDGKLRQVKPDEAIHEADWGNIAHLDGVAMVLRVRTKDEARRYLPILASLVRDNLNLSFYRKLHDLEATDGS